MSDGFAIKTKKETSCFFVPVLRFSSEEDGKDYLRLNPPLRVSLQQHPVGVLSIAGSLLVPCGDAVFPRHLIGSNGRARGSRVLWESEVPVPDGGELTCLLVDGEFTIEQNTEMNGRHSALWYRTMSGPRAVWGEWMKKGAVPFESAASVERRNGEAIRRYFFADIGCGALYRREPHIGNDGSVQLVEEIFALVAFALQSFRGGKRVLNVRRIARREFGHEGGFFEGLSVQDRRVISTARTRYLQERREATSVFEWKRRFLEAQSSGMRVRGKPFEAHLAKLGDDDWETALGLVREPWQLGCVVEEFCGPRFDSSRDVQDPQAQRIRRMIEWHRASAERKRQLLQMAEDYGLV